MKKCTAILLMVLACLLVACGGDDEPNREEPRLPDTSGSTQSSVVKVSSQSIASNAVVNADSTRNLKLVYTALISMKDSNLITLNNRIVSGVTVQDSVLSISLSLEAGQTYTLVVPGEALSAVNSETVSRFTLAFSTRATVNINSVDKSLCNKNACEDTKGIYDYLLSVYGKQTISGISEPVINTSAFCDLVYSVTQKYPAIISYNLKDIHTVNYSNQEKITEHHNNNGLLSLCWDWQVPTKENDDVANYTSVANQGFDIKQALIKGTWQYEFVENDIAIVAGHLQRLHEDGITVLFNPLSAAQNNWWGEADAPYFRELWKLLYDRLTVKYGLNNLIWVWTTETEDLTEELLHEWYPGDDFVDIIGSNIYAPDTGSQIDTFLHLNKTFGGKKMLALTECGNIPDFGKCFIAGDTWLYFSVMYSADKDGKISLDGSYNCNTSSHWNYTLNHVNVLDRGELTHKK